MKNFKFVLMVLGLAIVGGGIYKFTTTSIKKPEVMMKKDSIVTEIPQKEVMEKKDDSMMVDESENSRYIEYSKSVLEKAATNRRVLFFYASWCPTCRPADASFIENISKIPENVTVIRVNYNDPETDQEEKDLAKKYGITYQHTFVEIDAQGKEIKKWNGGAIEELITNTTK